MVSTCRFDCDDETDDSEGYKWTGEPNFWGFFWEWGVRGRVGEGGDLSCRITPGTITVTVD